MQLIVGVDYSIGCPGICTCLVEDEFSFDNCKLTYASTHNRWKNKSFLDGKITGHNHLGSDSPDMDRYINLSMVTMKAILQYKSPNISIAVEDYAFAGNGLASLGENMGILKLHMRKVLKLDPFTYSPGTIKKYARTFLPKERDNEGKLIKMDKECMHDAFVIDTGINLCDHLGLESVLTKSGSVSANNPVGDIIDAYWIAKYHHTQLKGK